MSEEIVVRRLAPEQREEWRRFLGESNNGTLFHDLDFLDYHPEGAFQTHHLLFYRKDKLLALLPAAVAPGEDGRQGLRSPYGASVGGLVLPVGTDLETAVSITQALKAYVRGLGLPVIALRLAPPSYLRLPDQVQEFSLATNGFRLEGRWLCFMAPLQEPIPAACRNKRKAEYIRSGLRKGVRPYEAGIDAFDAFYDLLLRTMDRHEAQPTHTREELARVMELVPGCVRIFLCEQGGELLSGVLLMRLNDMVANTFYICGNHTQAATAILIHHVMELLRSEGCRFLDMGPSASSHHWNRGTTFFKECLGARGHCRDLWVFDEQATDGPGRDSHEQHD